MGLIKALAGAAGGTLPVCPAIVTAAEAASIDGVRRLNLPHNFLNKSVKGTVRVCQNHAGEFACGAHARHYIIFHVMGTLNIYCFSHVH